MTDSDEVRDSWEMQERWSVPPGAHTARCLLDLRRRVEALEAHGAAQARAEQQPTPPPAPAGGLVERVMAAIERADGDHEASAAIRTTATWLRAHGHASAASALKWAKEVGE